MTYDNSLCVVLIGTDAGEVPNQGTARDSYAECGTYRRR